MSVSLRQLSAFAGAIITSSGITYGVVNALLIEGLKSDLKNHQREIDKLEAVNYSLEEKVENLIQNASMDTNDGKSPINNSIINNINNNLPASPDLVTQKSSKEGSSSGSDSVTPESMTIDMFELNLTECNLSGSILTLDFLVTDLKGDRNISFFNNARIFDDAGNEYRVRTMSFGNRSSSGNIGKQMIKGVSVKFSMTFKDIPDNIRLIKALQIPASSSDPREKFDYKFNNIPVVRN